MDNIFEEAEHVKDLTLKSNKALTDILLKLVEETGELASANAALHSYKHGSIGQVQEEVVDVLQNAMSLYFKVQSFAPFDGKALLQKKNTKWAQVYNISE